jgi:NitT/TauT family transport system permease protein
MPPGTASFAIAVHFWRAAVVVGAFGGWLLVSLADPTARTIFGDPILVLRQLAAWVLDGAIFYHLALTVTEALLGFVAGAVAGILVSFAFLFVPALRHLFDPLLAVLAVVPRIVLAPIFMIWFGLGILSKAALVTLIVFFIVYFNVEAGLRSVQGVLVDRARLMGANGFALVREIYGPASMVWLLSSLKVSVGFAFLGAIVAEYLGATAGIGSLIAFGQAQNDPNAVMAGLLVIFLVVVPLDQALTRIERLSVAWRG